MEKDKDIRFSDKKVDQSWKEQAEKEKGGATGRPASPLGNAPAAGGDAKSEQPSKRKTSKTFLNFLTSLGIQAMMHLGEVPNPETQKAEVNAEAAREIIDLLMSIKDKTEGNLGAEELHFFSTFLPELQLKFTQQS